MCRHLNHDAARADRALPHTSSTTLESFATIARAYCGAFEAFPTTSRDEFLTRIFGPLASAYAAGLGLPAPPYGHIDRASAVPADQLPPTWVAPKLVATEALTEEWAWEQWLPLYERLRTYLGPRAYYRTVFDGWAATEGVEVVGNLWDDLVEIYRDLYLGLRYWERGEVHNAHWEWRFTFNAHWGQHASGAIRALHALCALHQHPWPGPVDAD